MQNRGGLSVNIGHIGSRTGLNIKLIAPRIVGDGGVIAAGNLPVAKVNANPFSRASTNTILTKAEFEEVPFARPFDHH